MSDEMEEVPSESGNSGESPIVAAQITVTPVGTGNPDITKYIRECIKIAHLSEMKFQETPLGTVVRGPMDEVLKIIKKMHEVPFELGAKRVRTHVTIDDFREEDIEPSLHHTAAAQEIAIQQEMSSS
ncbi:MAG: MTH1187 family thiamine-binding protein [bacterium]